MSEDRAEFRNVKGQILVPLTDSIVFYQGNSRCHRTIILPRVQTWNITIVMTATKQNVFAMRVSDEEREIFYVLNLSKAL